MRTSRNVCCAEGATGNLINQATKMRGYAGGLKYGLQYLSESGATIIIKIRRPC